MGHCHMQLAVAGLGKHDIENHTRRLAREDLPGFAARERAAFAFARKTAGKVPITAEDFHGLVDQYGTERAADVVWWTCRCHYMICVADALQLPLESTNVFDGFATRAETTGSRGSE
jgi:hypothetical protein